MVKILHNPKCRKSRETLDLLNEKGLEVEIIEYLENPPTEKELKDILALLGIQPVALVRKSESIYKEKFNGKEFSDDEWINILVKNPKLIERPIVIKGNKAVIGRPPQNILDII